MTKTEAAFMAAFLEELSDRYSNDGCNDMFLDDTPENRLLVESADDWHHQHDPHHPVGLRFVSEKAKEMWLVSRRTPQGKSEPKQKIITTNGTILGYLKARFMTESGLEQKDLPEV